ncbi:hypothetical protein ZOSMA_29G01110 [Zostera marina]|uniref:Uncharacterized protein n=1 Tax=Zostera marina TaxID=29655 RepID=A0A0K9PE05_ZOSMR|nr:hypothetical protein ZOSMA_29G01110 [Zostera marina]
MLLPLRSAVLGSFPPLLVHLCCRCPHIIAAVTTPPSFPFHHHRSFSHRKNHLRTKLPQIPTPLHSSTPPIQGDGVLDEKSRDESIGDKRGEENRDETLYPSLSEIKALDETFGDESISYERNEGNQDETKVEFSSLSEIKALDETFGDESISYKRNEGNRDETKVEFSSLSEIKALDETFGDESISYERNEGNRDETKVEFSSLSEIKALDETFGDESISYERKEGNQDETKVEFSSLFEINAPDRTLNSGTAGFNISTVLVNVSLCLAIVVVVRIVMWTVATLRGEDSVPRQKAEDGKIVRELKLSLEDQRKVDEIKDLVMHIRGEEEAMLDIGSGAGAGETIIKKSLIEEIERRAGTEFQNKTEENGEKMKKKREIKKKVGDGDKAARRKPAFSKVKGDIASRDRMKGFDGSEWRNQRDSTDILSHSNDLEKTMLKESLEIKSVMPSKKLKPNSKERSRSGHGVSVSGAPISQSSSGSKELWWLKLPYVLCVYLRTGSEIDADSNDPMKRLYAMKMNPNSPDSPSHVIVFQDKNDATNLCYLLESHFESLGGFSTDIVPLPIKELKDAVLKNSMNVVVIKKSELRLYAGQPLVEVETAIRSIIQRNTDR